MLIGQQRGAPLVLHDLADGDAARRVGREHATEQVLALAADVQRLLEVGSHDAREHLLQPDQVVAAVVAALREGQHACTCRHALWMKPSFQPSPIQ
jgi:hypothetical protein